MASTWGEAWAQAFGDAWGSLTEIEPPYVQPIQDAIKWGYGPIITSKKSETGKTRQRRQNEALLLTLLM